MRPTVRGMREADVPRVGAIMVAAFNDVFRRHGYPEPFASVEVGTALAAGYLRLEPAHCFTAVRDGEIVGSGFVHPRGSTAGIGPITVDPAAQAHGAGRVLMHAVMDVECPSLRLVQDAFNVVSFPLYGTLGFAACGTIASLVRPETPGSNFGDESAPGLEIRDWQPADLDALCDLDTRLTGITRPGDLRFFQSKPPQVAAWRHGRPVGYLCFLRTTAGTFLGPAAAIDEAVLRALIDAAAQREADRVLRMRFPARHATLLRELLAAGFRIENLQTYMVRGPWTPPRGIELLALFPEAL